MFQKFYPSEDIRSTYDIDFERYYKEGYRGVIFDVDNTLVPHDAPADERAKKVYDTFAEKIGAENLYTAVEELNRTLHIPSCLKEVIADEAVFTEKLDDMAALAKADGCTKTNPVIPEVEEFKELFMKAYTRGE